jgi:quinol monooxygenase YgiN
MSIVAIAKLVAVEGLASTALELAKGSQAACLQLDACEKFEILQGEDNPHHFTLVEQWSSKEAHKAFFDALMKAPETLEAMKVFSKGPEIEYFNLQ